MATEQLHCEPGRIEPFLEGRLKPDEEIRFESHLNVCPQCRDQLEQTAAGRRDWQEATEFLRDDPLDGDSAVGELSGIAGLEHPASDQGVKGQAGNVSYEVLRIPDYFDPTDDPRMLGRFGGYEIVGIIGCGGMGVVLKGFEPALDRCVAIKVLAPHLATSGAARIRFAREARAAAAVLHENVVAIHRVAEANGLPYLVMPYVPGDCLQRRLDEQGALQLPEILRIGMQVAAGLGAAHAQGLVHRDIKPGNILLDSGVERVTITDFGLARAADDASLTRSGVITGTPQYMSPEQAQGELVDGRSDLFSLGSVLYVMCTGRPPFRAETAFGVLKRITESSPRPIREIAPDVPEWLCEIIARLHEKDPDRRFASADEVAELLGGWLAHVQQPAVVAAPRRLRHVPRRADRWKRIKTMGWASAAAGIVAAGLLWAMISPGSAPEETSIGPEPRGAAIGQRTDAELQQVSAMLMDERTLVEEYQRVRRQIAQIERELSPPEDDSGRWKSTVDELHRQLDALTERMKRIAP